MTEPGLRLDKWLWYARFYKSRSLAAKLCERGPMRINGAAVAKAHHLVREGDTLTFVWNGKVRVVRILSLGSRRGPASDARTLYTDLDASEPPEAAPAVAPAPPAEIPSGS